MEPFEHILKETLMFIAQKGWVRENRLFFDSLASFLSKKLEVTYVIVGQLLPDKKTVQTLSFVANGEVGSNVSYELRNTPCENVMGKNLCCFPSSIQQLFPHDLMLVDMHAESYIGIPLWDTKGNAIGLIALLDVNPIENSANIESILQIVAVRVAHEIERSNYERELIEKSKKLEEADRLKTAFLANVSHEIRTPMNAIMGFAELLKKNKSEEKQAFFIDIIQKRCTDLLGIINDILDISKLESNQLALFETAVNVGSLLDDIVLEYAPMLASQYKSNARFVSNTKTVRGTNIKVDVDRLKQVILNMLSNAFKFTEEGEVELGCILDGESGHIRFYVRDTGIGINPAKQDVIFERFRQADEQVITPKYGGTGLGLSISKGLVELMGGIIGVESEEGKGSTFYFKLPLVPTPINHGVTDQDSNTLSLQNKTILVVEDDFYNGEYLKELLLETNCSIILATSGLEALHVFKNHAPIDLVLLDIKLPDISGLDVAVKMMRDKPSVKIVAQTAYASAQDKISCIELGFASYIAKPIKREELFDILQATL